MYTDGSIRACDCDLHGGRVLRRTCHVLRTGVWTPAACAGAQSWFRVSRAGRRTGLPALPAAWSLTQPHIFSPAVPVGPLYARAQGSVAPIHTAISKKWDSTIGLSPRVQVVGVKYLDSSAHGAGWQPQAPPCHRRDGSAF